MTKIRKDVQDFLLNQDLSKNPGTAPYLDLLKIFAYETYNTCFKQGVDYFFLI